MSKMKVDKDLTLYNLWESIQDFHDLYNEYPVVLKLNKKHSYVCAEIDKAQHYISRSFEGMFPLEYDFIDNENVYYWELCKTKKLYTDGA